jgi:hypothetical protein
MANDHCVGRGRPPAGDRNGRVARSGSSRSAYRDASPEWRTRPRLRPPFGIRESDDVGRPPVLGQVLGRPELLHERLDLLHAAPFPGVRAPQSGDADTDIEFGIPVRKSDVLNQTQVQVEKQPVLTCSSRGRACGRSHIARSLGVSLKREMGTGLHKRRVLDYQWQTTRRSGHSGSTSRSPTCATWPGTGPPVTGRRGRWTR